MHQILKPTMTANYLKSIEVDELWHGGNHVKLEFQSGVNILSGMNGIGKSTIISKMAKGLSMINEGKSLSQYGVHLSLEPENSTSIRFNFIKSFDTPLMTAAQIEAIQDENVKTILDWKLYKLQNKEKLTTLPYWLEFCDLIDSQMKDTDKLIDRESNSLRFMQGDEMLNAYQLSAGEKNLLIIFLTVLMQNKEAGVLLLDEPEICLHIDWQRHLLENILTLNPNLQIILSSHSPAIVMDGWIDRITNL